MPRYRFIGDPLDSFDGPDRFEWMGVEFSRDEWADVSDPSIIAKLDANSHYEREKGAQTHTISVRDMPAQGHATDPVTARGAAAKAAGKKRTVPPAYRGKPEEARWLAGYDGPSE